MHRAKGEEAITFEDLLCREALCPSPGEFVPTSQESARAVEEECIQPPVHPRHGTVGEVVLPTSDDPIDLTHHFWPRSLIAGA